MKREKVKNIGWRLFLLSIPLWLNACVKSDDYKKYYQEGEIIYTGKVDSVKVYSGKNRVLISGLFKADPKVTKLKIFWDSRSDSVIVPVVRTENVDTLKLLVPISEGTHNFELITYDEVGNKSLSVYATGVSYGERFSAGIYNRPLSSSNFDASLGSTTIEWGGIDLTTGAIATEIEYTTLDGSEATVRELVDSAETILPNFSPGSSFRYRTLFLPDTTSIDTFYTDYASVTPEIGYFRNLGNPFQRSVWDGSRWGILANWITTASVKNAGSNTYGGYELRSGVGVLSIEGGWNLSPVTNGKIYQVSTLPAGTHRFTVSVQEAGDGGADTRYFVVATGEQLPDIDNVTKDALAYHSIPTGVNQNFTVDITLKEASRITMGFVASCPGNSSTGSYFKILGITFTPGEE